MASSLQYHDGTVKTVKNLGWILRNWRTVRDIEVMAHPDDGSSFAPDCLVIFHLDPRLKMDYVTDYASASVLWNFLKRPVFYGLTGTWFGTPFTVSKDGARPADPCWREEAAR